VTAPVLTLAHAFAASTDTAIAAVAAMAILVDRNARTIKPMADCRALEQPSVYRILDCEDRAHFSPPAYPLSPVSRAVRPGVVRPRFDSRFRPVLYGAVLPAVFFIRGRSVFSSLDTLAAPNDFDRAPDARMSCGGSMS
jgi:hypothetical protein